MLTLLKWLIPVDMTPEHKSEISPKFGRSLNAIFSQPFSCFNSNIAKSTQLSRGFIKVAKISQVRDTTKLCYVLYFHKAGTVKFSVALTVSRQRQFEDLYPSLLPYCQDLVVVIYREIIFNSLEQFMLAYKIYSILMKKEVQNWQAILSGQKKHVMQRKFPYK